MHACSAHRQDKQQTKHSHDLIFLHCCVTVQNKMVKLDHDWRPGGTLGLIGDPSLRLGDSRIIPEGILRIILMLPQTMFPRRIPPRRGRLAVVAGIRLVIWVMRVPVTLDGVRPCRVVVTSGEVAEVMVRDLLTRLLSLLLLLGLKGEASLGLLVVVVMLDVGVV